MTDRLKQLTDTELGHRLRDAGATSDADTLRVLRNKLSHGEGVFAALDLDPWVRLLQDVAARHLTRLLRLDLPDPAAESNP